MGVEIVVGAGHVAPELGERHYRGSVTGFGNSPLAKVFDLLGENPTKIAD
jgi:hypothetical protein